jgi:hypothetical protein
VALSRRQAWYSDAPRGPRQVRCKRSRGASICVRGRPRSCRSGVSRAGVASRYAVRFTTRPQSHIATCTSVRIIVASIYPQARSHMVCAKPLCTHTRARAHTHTHTKKKSPQLRIGPVRSPVNTRNRGSSAGRHALHHKRSRSCEVPTAAGRHLHGRVSAVSQLCAGRSDDRCACQLNRVQPL